MNTTDFVHRKLPVVGKRVLRMGLAPSFGIDADEIAWLREFGARAEGRGFDWL